MAKVKIDSDLHARAAQHAKAKGYSSLEEFVAHALECALREEREERELSKGEEAAVAERLRGLGYIE